MKAKKLIQNAVESEWSVEICYDCKARNKRWKFRLISAGWTLFFFLSLRQMTFMRSVCTLSRETYFSSLFISSAHFVFIIPTRDQNDSKQVHWISSEASLQCEISCGWSGWRLSCFQIIRAKKNQRDYEVIHKCWWQLFSL